MSSHLASEGRSTIARRSVPPGAPAVHLPIAMSLDPDNPPVAPAVGGLDAFTSPARGIRGLRNHGNGVQR